MRLGILIIFLFSVAHSSPAQSPHKQRVDSIRSFFTSADIGPDIYASLAKMRSAEHQDEGIRMFDQLTRIRSVEIIDRFRISVVYLYARNLLPDSLRARIEALWESTPTQPFLDEHERVIYYTSLLLCAESFPSNQSWFNGRTSKENEDDAKAFLRHWAQTTAESGQQEYDSPTYGGLFICAMVLLRDFSRDDDIRKLGESMAQWLIADYAHEYFGGQFGGSHAREDLFSAMQPIQSEMGSIAWLYFGDGIQLYGREQYILSLSNFVPQQALVELATAKLKPFEAWEIKRSADRIRGDTTRSYDVLKYTYADPLYIVGSVSGGFHHPREQHSWDVTWTSDQTQTTLFTMQPYAEPSGLLDFYPHSLHRAFRRMEQVDQYWGTPAKTVGGSPFEQLFQYKNTVIALYDVGNVKIFPFMIGFLPHEVEAFDYDSAKTGWITINAGDVYLAMLPLKSFTLYVEDAGRRLVSRDARNGAIVQVVGRNIAGAYKDFRTKVLKSRVDRGQFESNGILKYHTIFGDELTCSLDGTFLINSKPRTVDRDMLFNSPWIHSRRGSGTMTITAPSGKLLIDIPNRVVRKE